MSTRRPSLPSVATPQSILPRAMPARPERVAPGVRTRRGSRNEPRLYTWEELGTTQRQAVLEMVHTSRVRRRRARRVTVVITVLLVLLVVAGVAIIFVGLGSQLTFSL